MDPETVSSVECEEYTMEKVVSKRVKNGRCEYLVKWLDFDDDENTWEVAKDIDDKLVQDFESKMGENNDVANEPSTSGQGNPYGFARNLKPMKVLGASCNTGELLFLMQWKGTNTVDWVSSKEARQKCPQILLDFYEQNIKWSPYTSNQD